jgi:hypothetical protein
MDDKFDGLAIFQLLDGRTIVVNSSDLKDFMTSEVIITKLTFCAKNTPTLEIKRILNEHPSWDVEEIIYWSSMQELKNNYD